MRRKITSKPATTEAEAVSTAPITVEATVINKTTETTPATIALITEDELPDPDAPAINASEPEVSFKIDFKDKSQWFASEDGGATKEGTDSPILIGAPIDLMLQLSKATWNDGFDQRLRLAFLFDDGGVGEINLNAVNHTATGELYVTSPARSLTGGLLAISEAEEDMAAFCRQARFTIRPGRGKGVFIDVDIPSGKRWVAMSAAARTNQIAKDPAGFHSQLALIKQRFRACGLLLTGGAISGDISGYDAAMRLLEAGSDSDS